MELNGDEVLRKVLGLEVSTWRYDWEPQHVRHCGPMAQDFMEAFGLGESDRVIMSVDMFGITLVSLQALVRRVAALEHKLGIDDGGG